MSNKYNLLPKEAVTLFDEGLYCSEAILQVYNKYLSLGLSDAALKMATGFGAGLGASKCCCGSLTGAALVLSAVYGRVNPDESADPAFEKISELHNRFKERYKSTCCRVLTKEVQWGSQEHHRHCEVLVEGAAEILSDILSRETGVSV